MKFGWTKSQIDAEPRDYIRDLLTAIRAEQDYMRNKQAAAAALAKAQKEAENRR
jgi:hypothetical protein